MVQLERRQLPPKGKWWKGQERRVSWRAGSLGLDALSRSLFVDFHSVEMNRGEMREQDQKAEAIIEPLSSRGCDRKLVLSLAKQLALPIETWKAKKPNRETSGKEFKETANTITSLLSEIASHPSGRYTDREIWIVTHLAELLAECEPLLDKVIQTIEELPLHYRRAYLIYLLGNHLRNSLGECPWSPIADLIGTFSAGMTDIPEIASAEALEKAFQRAQRYFQGNLSSN